MKPVEQHKREGTYRAARHGNEIQFPVLEEIPEPPEDFSEQEAVHWYRYANSLKEMGLLSNAFLTSLTCLCRWEKLSSDLLRAVDVNQEGINRTLTDAVKAGQMVIKLRAKLGLSPADKRKVQGATPKRLDDDFDAL